MSDISNFQTKTEPHDPSGLSPRFAGRDYPRVGERHGIRKFFIPPAFDPDI